jgi:hypothetical protein
MRSGLVPLIHDANLCCLQAFQNLSRCCDDDARAAQQLFKCSFSVREALKSANQRDIAQWAKFPMLLWQPWARCLEADNANRLGESRPGSYPQGLPIAYVMAVTQFVGTAARAAQIDSAVASIVTMLDVQSLNTIARVPQYHVVGQLLAERVAFYPTHGMEAAVKPEGNSVDRAKHLMKMLSNRQQPWQRKVG